MEFFGHLPEQGRKSVRGATFQTADKTANMIGEVPKEMDALIARLNEGLVDRLQDEPNSTARVQIFGFPSQVASLKQPIYDFLTRILSRRAITRMRPCVASTSPPAPRRAPRSIS